MYFFFQAEDGIRDLVRSRGLGDVYKRQVLHPLGAEAGIEDRARDLHHEIILVADGGNGLVLSLIHI